MNKLRMTYIGVFRRLHRMKKWRVKVNGTNFRWKFEDTGKTRVRRIGFITFLFVLGDSPRDAEVRAVEELRKDKRLKRGLHNAKGDPPRLFVQEIKELASFLGCC